MCLIFQDTITLRLTLFCQNHNPQLMNKGLFIHILVTMAVIAGCKDNHISYNIESNKIGDFKIRIIDSCEYIEYDNGMFDERVYTLTHKGNCKYCAARNAKK